MKYYYADLHIHIGCAQGKAVKITASRHLTLRKVLFEDAPRKGLDIVGMVDAGSPLVSAEIKSLLAEGAIKEQPGGGFLAANGVMLVTGCEIETREGIHIIIYLPDLGSVAKLQQYLITRVSNLNLSTPASPLQHTGPNQPQCAAGRDPLSGPCFHPPQRHIWLLDPALGGCFRKAGPISQGIGTGPERRYRYG